MLAAMARGARAQYANRVNLLSLPFFAWQVPAGVTTVNVFAAASGGNVTMSPSNTGFMGAGGGSAILNVPLTVTPGDTITAVQGGVASASEQYVDYTVQDGTATTLFNLQHGHDSHTSFSSPFIALDGRGGTVTWEQGGTVTATGGAMSGSVGGAGGNGQKVACLGGWLISGGGGGRGGTTFPVQQGGKGGDAGDFAGILDTTPAGGGGGGYFPGQYYRGNTTATPSGQPFSFIFLEYN